MTQVERLRELLADGQWHSTVEILGVVYGLEHSGIARIGARIWDLSKRLHAGESIESKRDPERKTVWLYRLVRPQPPPDLFGHAATAVGYLLMVIPLWMLQ